MVIKNNFGKSHFTRFRLRKFQTESQNRAAIRNLIIPELADLDEKESFMHALGLMKASTLIEAPLNENQQFPAVQPTKLTQIDDNQQRVNNLKKVSTAKNKNVEKKKGGKFFKKSRITKKIPIKGNKKSGDNLKKAAETNATPSEEKKKDEEAVKEVPTIKKIETDDKHELKDNSINTMKFQMLLMKFPFAKETPTNDQKNGKVVFDEVPITKNISTTAQKIRAEIVKEVSTTRAIPINVQQQHTKGKSPSTVMSLIKHDFTNATPPPASNDTLIKIAPLAQQLQYEKMQPNPKFPFAKETPTNDQKNGKVVFDEVPITKNISTTAQKIRAEIVKEVSTKKAIPINVQPPPPASNDTLIKIAPLAQQLQYEKMQPNPMTTVPQPMPSTSSGYKIRKVSVKFKKSHQRLANNRRRNRYNLMAADLHFRKISRGVWKNAGKKVENRRNPNMARRFMMRSKFNAQNRRKNNIAERYSRIKTMLAEAQLYRDLGYLYHHLKMKNMAIAKASTYILKYSRITGIENVSSEF